MKEKRIFQLPEKFRRNILDLHAERGERWLRDLPDLITAISAEWSLSVGKHFPNLSYNYVAPCVRDDGTQAVLKIGVGEKNSVIFGEAKFLELLDGNGAVKLLRFDKNYCALLLERLIPGENLQRICQTDDREATRIAIEVMRRLRCNPPETIEFPRLEIGWTVYARLQK